MTSTPASLLDRLARGTDSGSWDRFVELYTPALVGWCRRLGLTDADAADLIQDIFVILVEQLPTFTYDPARSFRAWLRTILLNAWRQRTRAAARRPEARHEQAEAESPDPTRLIEEQEFQAHLVRQAVSAIRSDFEPRVWSVFEEFLLKGRPAAEVAAELGVTVNSVYLTKSRVLAHLRTELRGLLD